MGVAAIPHQVLFAFANRAGLEKSRSRPSLDCPKCLPAFLHHQHRNRSQRHDTQILRTVRCSPMQTGLAYNLTLAPNRGSDSISMKFDDGIALFSERNQHHANQFSNFRSRSVGLIVESVAQVDDTFFVTARAGTPSGKIDRRDLSGGEYHRDSSEPSLA